MLARGLLRQGQALSFQLSRGIMAGSQLNSALQFETLECSRPREWVVQVALNRPAKRNALDATLWREIGECFAALDEDEDCRAVVLSGNGRSFCSGLDFSAMAELGSVAMDEKLDVSRKYKRMTKTVQRAQDPFTAIERCQKPVIAAVHGAAMGGALGILTACDIRYAALDAIFSIKEVDIGISADVGTLQRMPKQVAGDSLMRELAFTARDFYADEAKAAGLVSRETLGDVFAVFSPYLGKRR